MSERLRFGQLHGRKPNMKKRMQGVVKSDGMDKTIVVTVQRLVKHPRVKKYIRRNSRFMAHDAHNEARVGDTVEIEETRPLSRFSLSAVAS